MKSLIIAVLLLAPCAVNAQTTSSAVNSDIQQFEAWLGQQQARAGIGYIFRGDRAKYAVTSWNLLQIGQAGLNVAQPSKAHDYVDIAPMLAAANQRAPRYGSCLAVHGGNIWNDVHLPSNIESHINKTPLPPFIISYCPLWPNENGINLPLSKMKPWSRDGMVAFSYGFGGS